ncbi:hypothetical protein [Candidatus Similichlamydia laticola]|nr:hypothetical protein [Candidatus Similichlamydia laticola]
MRNRFSFFRLGCLALLCASSPLIPSGTEQPSRRAALRDANKSSEEYRKLFSTLLNPNGIDFEEFGEDSKAISVIGMFSDEKISGAELQVMHWINFNSSEDYGERCASDPLEVEALKERAKVKRHALREQVEEERLQVQDRVATHRERLDRNLREQTENELRALKEKSRTKAEEKLLKEQQEDLNRMLDLERRMQKQEEEVRAIAELETRLEKQDLERRKQILLEGKLDEKLNDQRDLSQRSKRRVNERLSREGGLLEEEGFSDDDLLENKTEPLFQGSLWRISPGSGGFEGDKSSGRRAVGRFSEEDLPNTNFSSEEKSVILESLDKIERAQSLNRSPRLRNLPKETSGVYPYWAAGSPMLEGALDKCKPGDEFLVLAFRARNNQVPREMIIKDLQKYGISPKMIQQSVTFVECENSKNVDRKVEDLLTMSGIHDGPGYLVIELPGKMTKSTAKIVRACPLPFDRELRSKVLSFRGK